MTDKTIRALFVPIFVLAVALALSIQTALAQTPGQPPVPTGQTNLELWTYVVGVVLPLIVAIVVQSQWGRPMQAIVCVLLCIVAGAVTCYLNDSLNPADVAGSVLRVFVAAITSYYGFWRPLNIAPTIEAHTTIDHTARHLAINKLAHPAVP